MAFGSRTGEFASENVEILAAKPKYCRIEQDADKIRLVDTRPGFMMIIK